MVTVILEADGFADLLERTEFMERVSQQDRRIIERVRRRQGRVRRRRAASSTRSRTRQREVTAIVERRRQEVVEVKDRLVDQRQQYAGVRADKHAGARLHPRRPPGAREPPRVAREASRRRSRRGSPARRRCPPAPIREGSGSLIWPVNGTFTSPFGYRWGRLHAGIDIAVPEGTPLRAAAAGSVVIAGWTGGYGNYTCIQHGGAMSTCYGHQSRIATSVGARVSQGQVIGYSGNTGNSTGPHLHFEVRINGVPQDPMGYL